MMMAHLDSGDPMPRTTFYCRAIKHDVPPPSFFLTLRGGRSLRPSTHTGRGGPGNGKARLVIAEVGSLARHFVSWVLEQRISCRHCLTGRRSGGEHRGSMDRDKRSGSSCGGKRGKGSAEVDDPAAHQAPPSQLLYPSRSKTIQTRLGSMTGTRRRERTRPRLRSRGRAFDSLRKPRAENQQATHQCRLGAQQGESSEFIRNANKTERCMFTRARARRTSSSNLGRDCGRRMGIAVINRMSTLQRGSYRPPVACW